jgi:hypothetical protein
MKTPASRSAHLLLMSFCLLGLAACQSDDEAPVPIPANEVRPIAQFLTKSIISVTKVDLGSSSNPNPDGGGAPKSSEFGFAFSSSASGRVTKVGVLYPQLGQYVVSIWDLATGTRLFQTNVNQTQADQPTYLSIPPLALEVSKQYVISANNHLVTNKSYNLVRFKTTQTSPLLPFTESPITVIESRSQASETPVLPKSVSTNSMFGCVDLGFVAD